MSAETFGALLRSLRLAADVPPRYPAGRGRWAAAPLSMNQVARLAGVNVAYVYRLEKAIETAPSRSVVEKLAAALEADELNTAQLLVRAVDALEHDWTRAGHLAQRVVWEHMGNCSAGFCSAACVEHTALVAALRGAVEAAG